MTRNRSSDVNGRYRLSGAHQGIQVTLLVLTLNLRMREMDHSVLEAPPLAVSKDEIEPIMHAAERVPVTSMEAYAFQNWI